MKPKLLDSLSLLTVVLLFAAFAYGQKTDLSMRRALYFTGTKTEKIDLKNDKYVAEGSTITVDKSEATFCDYEACSFHVGIIVFRKPAAGALTVFAELQREDLSVFGNSFLFADKEATHQLILDVKLKPGSKTKVTFLIDPNHQVPESDENNNSFSVWIKVGNYKP